MTSSVIAIPDSLLDIDATFLPVRQMRQLSRVTSLDGPSLTAIVDLGPAHWVYAQHFPDDPIFPGTLIVEAAGQAVALWAWAQGLRGRPRLVRTSASFHYPVTPATPFLELRAQVRTRRTLHFGAVEVMADGRLAATIEAVLTVLPST